jgi:hypothetical protein
MYLRVYICTPHIGERLGVSVEAEVEVRKHGTYVRNHVVAPEALVQEIAISDAASQLCRVASQIRPHILFRYSN